MPVKGKTTKSRTAKSKGKGLKLKWWYILPVIAIVAVAGYAIVRYSQASSIIWSYTGDQLLSAKKVSKGAGVGTLASLPAGVSVPLSKFRLNKNVCANVTGPVGSQVAITVYQQGQESRMTGFGLIGNSGNGEVCVKTNERFLRTNYIIQVTGSKNMWTSLIFQKT